MDNFFAVFNVDYFRQVPENIKVWEWDLVHGYIFMFSAMFFQKRTTFVTFFSYLWDRLCSIFSSAGKFCLAHGLRQLTRDTIYDISCLQMLLAHPNKKLWVMLVVGHHTMLTVIILFKTLTFPIIGKKNNQSSVSDADWEIPTLGSMDNAGNLVNLVSSRAWISRSASETNGRFYFSSRVAPSEKGGKNEMSGSP